MASQTAEAAASTATEADDTPTFSPPTDIYETKDAVMMLLEMPGADPDSLNVNLDKRVLTVSARSVPFMPEGYNLIHAEYRDGNYERAFTLSDQVDGDRVDAVFKNGVLRLTLPKTAQSQAKKIPVKSA
jgi:HSP20 family molecular chaperone IbpA